MDHVHIKEIYTPWQQTESQTVIYHRWCTKYTYMEDNHSTADTQAYTKKHLNLVALIPEVGKSMVAGYRVMCPPTKLPEE